MLRGWGWRKKAMPPAKGPHSLEKLKQLYAVLQKNQTITESNKGLLVETLRSISEILIWGDQNDSSVFDFFLEKNMLMFFLRYLEQKWGRQICVQLLQTLNILFENISNETSIYYLLSNNHVSSIICHKFDFSDEEVMAYYISFLKTLSLKLNKHTIHFFYNEQTNDFALYTEAIKFFNHPESMVRIAVRTITLNVYRVDNKPMLRFIRDHTAAPYFSNLVWFVGSHVLELDSCVRNDSDHRSRGRLSTYVSEHLDHLHYMNDILSLDIEALNDVLTDHLLDRLFMSLYVYSILPRRLRGQADALRVDPVVALFLLSQVYLIIKHKPLVRRLTAALFGASDSVPIVASSAGAFASVSASPHGAEIRPQPGPAGVPAFCPSAVLQQHHSDEDSDAFETGNFSHRISNSMFYVSSRRPSYLTSGAFSPSDEAVAPLAGDSTNACDESAQQDGIPMLPLHGSPAVSSNPTDDEKLLTAAAAVAAVTANGGSRPVVVSSVASLASRPYLKAILDSMEAIDGDYRALITLCLLYAIGTNEGISQEIFGCVPFTTVRMPDKSNYNTTIIERLIKIVTLSSQYGSKVRLITTELAIVVLKHMTLSEDGTVNFLRDDHLAALEAALEECMLLLRRFFKGEEMFLDMFEDEYHELTKKKLNVEYLMMDATILLQPTGTPLTGIEFSKRLPCGEVERARRAIRVYLLLRDLLLKLRNETEKLLPLAKNDDCVRSGEALDLNNSDLIGCTVVQDSKRERRFLVIDLNQLILVEPDVSRLGWGVVRFSGLLQDVDVMGDKDDSRSLHVTVHKIFSASVVSSKAAPLLAARFIFDDHIRCMAAKQRLTKGRLRARQRKMQIIGQMLDIPPETVNAMFQSPSSAFLVGAAMSRPLPGRAVARISPSASPMLSPNHGGAKKSFSVSASGVRESSSDGSPVSINGDPLRDDGPSLRERTVGDGGSSGGLAPDAAFIPNAARLGLPSAGHASSRTSENCLDGIEQGVDVAADVGAAALILDVSGKKKGVLASGSYLCDVIYVRCRYVSKEVSSCYSLQCDRNLMNPFFAPGKRPIPEANRALYSRCRIDLQAPAQHREKGRGTYLSFGSSSGELRLLELTNYRSQTTLPLRRRMFAIPPGGSLAEAPRPCCSLLCYDPKVAQ